MVKVGWDRFFSVLEPIKDSVVKGSSSEELDEVYNRLVAHNLVAEKEFLAKLEERKENQRKECENNENN